MVLSTKVAQMRLTTCVCIVYYTSDIFWRVKTTSGEMFTSWGYMVTFCESLTFFWGRGWIFITFMGLLSLKVGTWTPKNLGRSSTPYCNRHDSDNAWYTHPSFRKKEEVLILELPHIALLTHSSDTFLYFWNCTVVENTMRWGINELWIIKNHDVYFHTKNVLGFKVALSVQGLSIIAAPVLCGWDLLCGDMKGKKYAWGKDSETQWEKKRASELFQLFSFVIRHHPQSSCSFQVKSVGCIHGWNYLHKWTLTALWNKQGLPWGKSTVEVIIDMGGFTVIFMLVESNED